MPKGQKRRMTEASYLVTEKNIQESMKELLDAPENAKYKKTVVKCLVKRQVKHCKKCLRRNECWTEQWEYRL